MEDVLKPPSSVYLMKTLDKSAFQKTIKVPLIHLESNIKPSSILHLLKRFLLKMENFKPIINDADTEETFIYLNPEVIQNWNDLPSEVRNGLERVKISQSHFNIKELQLQYDNYNVETLFKAILPKESDGCSSYTKIGHITHVNLREHLIPYKDLIGDILLDKIKGCDSVVNKVNMIDNTYRNFQMEILKGSNNMLTTVKENNCKFEFDFSTVYWNSRLCTEHERIIKTVTADSVLFDVFAGVGPFAIPAAKKKCLVFANDLNPESFKWLMHNKKLNKVSDDRFEGFNLDGKEFIAKIIKEKLPNYLGKRPVIVTMNLPALAVEFLNNFLGLFNDKEVPKEFEPIVVYVYCFTKGENPKELAIKLIEDNFKVENVNGKIKDIFKVRTVSSMKEMMRVTLHLDREVLVKTNSKRKLSEHQIEFHEEIKKNCFRDDGQETAKQNEQGLCGAKQ